MNQVQRKYLINKIKEKTKAEIDVLERSKPEAPSIANYLIHTVMSGDFQLQSLEYIKQVIKQKALKSKKGTNWLSNDRWSSSETEISFNVGDIFILPDEYEHIKNKTEKELAAINDKIHNLTLQTDTLITRITLASDKTLQTMINEIDDMGNISLMDTKLKQLTQ